MIVLVVGPDATAARAEVERLVAAHDPEGANTSRYDARETSVNEIAAAVGSLGFFGGARVVVAQHLLAKASRGTAVGDSPDEPAPKGGLDLAPLFASVPDQNLLILLDAALSAVPAAAKKATPAAARIIACEPPRGRALLEWMRSTARAAGGEIEPAAAQLLADTLFPQTWKAKPSNPRYDRPPDTDLLTNELAKLVMAAHPDPVRPQHVHALSAGAPSDRLFRFLEAAESGRLSAALVELEHLLADGEEPAKLSAQVAQQTELAVVADAAPGRDPVAIGRDLGLPNPNRMTGIASRRRQRAGAASALVDTLAADRAFKRGLLRRPEDALYAQLLAPPATRGDSIGGT